MARSQVRKETVRRRQPLGPASKPAARARGYRFLTIGRADLPHRASATVPACVPAAPVWIHRCSSRQYFLNCGRELICFSASADSFFKKNAGRATGDRGWCGEETIDARNLKAGHRLASAEFFGRSPHPVPFYQTVRRTRSPAFSQNQAGRILHHLDRARLLSYSNPRSQYPGRSELGEMVEGDQAVEAAGNRTASFAGHRFGAGNTCAF